MIIDWLEEWFKGVLIDGIIGNLSGLFDTVNTKVGEIAADVGATPQGWNSGIFNMIRNLSESVIIPIAGAILAFVMTYELIQMVTEKNNLHDIDTFMFFKWVFKTYAAVLIVTNTWNIVMGVFDAAQQVVNQSAGVIIGNTSIDIDSLVGDLQTSLEAMSLSIWLSQSDIRIYIDAENADVEPFDKDGIAGYFFKKEDLNYVCFERDACSFSVYGSLDMDELIKIAAGITKE